MIKVKPDIFKIEKFPDGTPHILADIDLYESLNNPSNIFEITWCFDSMEEYFTLYTIVRKLREDFYCKEIGLNLPYIPNARMDRIKEVEDTFTLKYFCKLINDLKLDYVNVLDQHSDVSVALLDNVYSVGAKYQEALRYMKSEYNIKDPLLFYPDNGASKKYSSYIEKPFAFGIKNRDWKTGKILGLDIYGEDVKGRDILIIDDICSKGGTFYHSAKKLKELGANRIFLYVSHCENTIFEGDLLKEEGLIEKIYTTSSIYRGKHEKIQVVYYYHGYGC